MALSAVGSTNTPPGDRSSQVIVDVTQTRRNKSQCSNRAGTLEQLREHCVRITLVFKSGPYVNKAFLQNRDVHVAWKYFGCCAYEFFIEFAIFRLLQQDWSHFGGWIKMSTDQPHNLFHAINMQFFPIAWFTLFSGARSFTIEAVHFNNFMM